MRRKRKPSLRSLLGKLAGGSGHKYHAKKQVTEDGKFDSKAELTRWLELKQLEASGKISGLDRTRKVCTFELHGLDGTVACRYVADYVYVEEGQSIVEDCKGMKTPVYRLKRKLFLAEYGAVHVHRES